jgi:hypothetical protein
MLPWSSLFYFQRPCLERRSLMITRATPTRYARPISSTTKDIQPVLQQLDHLLCQNLTSALGLRTNEFTVCPPCIILVTMQQVAVEMLPLEVMTEFVTALRDFVAEDEEDLPFRAGDRIEIIEKDYSYDDGWWTVCIFLLGRREKDLKSL